LVCVRPRAHAERLREFLHLLPNGFSPATTTAIPEGRLAYGSAGRRPRLGQSKIKLVSDGAKFFLILLKVITVFSPLRIFVPIAGAEFALGSGYALWTAVHERHITNSSVLLILLAVVIFLVGLVSEQISTMRSEGPR
jgi:hypothetical protein